MTRKQLQEIARKEGTPVVVIDHNIIRANYKAFHQHMPRVQAYYAVKANPEPAIVRSLYKIGASFDVASLAEFRLVYENIKDLPAKEQQDFIWDKIIYANPTKPRETLEALDQYKPLVTFDNLNELKKIKRFAPHAGVVLRLRVPNTGSVVELSSKFGADPSEAVTLIQAAFDLDLVVEGLSFHVGSQCMNFENFVQALNISASVMEEAGARGHKIKDTGHRRRLPRALSPRRGIHPGAGAQNQRRGRPPLFQGHRHHRRAGAVRGGFRGHLRRQGHRQGPPRRQDLRLY